MGTVQRTVPESYDTRDSVSLAHSPASAAGSTAFPDTGTAPSSASSTSSTFYASLNKYILHHHPHSHNNNSNPNPNHSHNLDHNLDHNNNKNYNLNHPPPHDGHNTGMMMSSNAADPLESFNTDNCAYPDSTRLPRECNCPNLPPPIISHIIRDDPPHAPHDITTTAELESDLNPNPDFLQLGYHNDNSSSSQSPATVRMLSRATSRAFPGQTTPTPTQRKSGGASLSAATCATDVGNQEYDPHSPDNQQPLPPPSSSRNCPKIDTTTEAKTYTVTTPFSQISYNNPFLTQPTTNTNIPHTNNTNSIPSYPFPSDPFIDVTNDPSNNSQTDSSDFMPSSNNSNIPRLNRKLRNQNNNNNKNDNNNNNFHQDTNQNRLNSPIGHLQRFEPSFEPSSRQDDASSIMSANSSRSPPQRVNATPATGCNIQYEPVAQPTFNSKSAPAGSDYQFNKEIIYNDTSDNNSNMAAAAAASTTTPDNSTPDFSKTLTKVDTHMRPVTRMITPPPTEMVLDKGATTIQATTEFATRDLPSTAASNAIPTTTPTNKAVAKPQKRRAIGDWDFMKSIGAGSMGQVKLAHNRKTGEYGAIKIVPISCSPQHRSRNTSTEKGAKKKESDISKDTRTVREAAIGKLLHHRYICQLYDMYQMTSHYYMIFEYVSGGQMLDYIISHGSLKEKHAQKFARGIASALDYCHKNSIVHRDLKIENILISKSGEIKLIDFGLSNLFSNSSLLKTFCGSLYFAAPELLEAKPYIGPEIDVWSFGVVIFVLVCGKVPFDDQNIMALHAKIKQGKINYPEWLSTECRDLLVRMLNVNPKERITLPQVMNHPWMIKGYGGPPDSYMPYRRPLSISQLDTEIISEMAGFNFGSEEKIYSDIVAVLNSPEYKYNCSVWEKLNAETSSNHPSVSASIASSSSSSSKHNSTNHQNESNKNSLARHLSSLVRRNILVHRNHDDNKDQGNSNISNESLPLTVSQEPGTALPSFMYTDPTAGFHPLLSVYYLVAEKNQRDLDNRIIEEAKQFDVSHHSRFPLSSGTGDLITNNDTNRQYNSDPFSNDNQVRQPPPSLHVNSDNRHLRSKSETKPRVSSIRAGYKPMYPERPNNNAVHTLTSPISSPNPYTDAPLPLSPKSTTNENHLSRNSNNNKYRADFKDTTTGHPPIDTAVRKETNSHSSSLASSLLRRFSGRKKTIASPESAVSSLTEAKSPIRPSFNQDNIDVSPNNNNKNNNHNTNDYLIPDVPQLPKIYIPDMAEIKALNDSNSSNHNRKDVSVQRSTSVSVPVHRRTPANINEVHKDSHPPMVFSGMGRSNIVEQQTTDIEPVISRASSENRNFHPSARAKSASHIRRDSVNRRYEENMGRPTGSNNASESKYYENFDIVDDYLDKSVNDAYDGKDNCNFNNSNDSPIDSGTGNMFMASKDLGEGVTQSNPVLGENSKPISIDHPKQVFVKGIFSAQTTSTKPLAFIRDDLIRVLNKLGISYREVQGGFRCSNIVASGDNLPAESHTGHRRKFSFGSGFFGTPKGKNHHEQQFSGSPGYRRHSIEFPDDFSTDSITHNTSMGGSDIIGFSPAAAHADSMTSDNDEARVKTQHRRSSVEFEIYIVKVRIVSLHGIQFKKLSGNTWKYKALASNILNELRL